jgi:hypothetical protein
MAERDEKPDRPPAPAAVARRALILSGVMCRAFLEGHPDARYRREVMEEIREWFHNLGLWAHLEPEEEKLIRSPFGAMTKWRQRQGTWYSEGLAILAWALGRSNFPPHDRRVDPIAITNTLSFLDPEAADLLTSPSLRGPKELEAAREWFYDLHCTFRGFLYHGGDGRLASWVGDYLAVLGIEPKAVMHEGGLTFDGSPLAEADRERLEGWEQVVFERHRAAIWLLGEEPLYTELAVDT